jgi:hypothetical protein
MPRSVNPRPQFFDSSGDPLVSGLMYFYEPGTTTDKTTYADVNLSIANSNPVVLSADGRLPNVWFDGSARQVLRDADGTLIWDIDPVGGNNITGPLSEWSPDVTYGMFDIVITSDGRLWRSLIDANADNAPASSPASWEQLEFITIWNTNVTYALNATVKASNGLFYKSLANGNIANNPTTDAVNWGPIVDVLVLGLADGGDKTGGFTAAVSTRYTVSGALTMKTPGPTSISPSKGAIFAFGKYGTDLLTVNLDGLNFEGSPANPVTTTPGFNIWQYTDATTGWVQL